MRVRTDFYGGIKITLMPCDTAEWANRPGQRWRGSTLCGRRVEVELSPSGDLLETRIDGGFHAVYSDCELRAMLDDCMIGEGVAL